MEGPERDTCFPRPQWWAPWSRWKGRGQGGPTALTALSSGTQDENLLSTNPLPTLDTRGPECSSPTGEGGQPGPFLVRTGSWGLREVPKAQGSAPGHLTAPRPGRS